MSTDSRGRALESRTPRGRLIGIALWAGFLGAALQLLAVMVLLPLPDSAPLGFDTLGRLFLSSWVVSLVTAAMALFLALPLMRDGR